MVTNRELPQSGERWRHFKGGEYWVIGLAFRWETKQEFVIYAKSWIDVVCELSRHQSFIVKDTEAPHHCYYLASLGENYWWLYPTEYLANRNVAAWARPLDNFMGIASSSSGDEASNCYRFERITDQPIRISLTDGSQHQVSLEELGDFIKTHKGQIVHESSFSNIKTN